LVEAPYKGILALLDEACVNVGKMTDEVSKIWNMFIVDLKLLIIIND
jgi:hypothetical protein